MKNKLLQLAAVAAMLGILLVGCGKDNEPMSGTPSPSMSGDSGMMEDGGMATGDMAKDDMAKDDMAKDDMMKDDGMSK